jgi:hypothetical protein
VTSKTVNPIAIEKCCEFRHINGMATNSKTIGKRTPAKRYRVAGVTRDGVKILATGPATHFTDKEIRDTIRTVLRESHSGQFLSVNAAGRKP